MKNRAMMFGEIAVTCGAVELPPLAAIGMSIGSQVVQPQPTAIVTSEMRTKVHGGIDSTGAAMGERHGIGPWRRSWSISTVCCSHRAQWGLCVRPANGL